MTTGRDIVTRALEQFKLTLTPDDARTFSATTNEDLWEGLRRIEEEQGMRLGLRFMRRIEPFLVAMESYAPIIEVFCQGFSPMAWAWVCFLSITLHCRNSEQGL